MKKNPNNYGSRLFSLRRTHLSAALIMVLLVGPPDHCRKFFCSENSQQHPSHPLPPFFLFFLSGALAWLRIYKEHEICPPPAISLSFFSLSFFRGFCCRLMMQGVVSPLFPCNFARRSFDFLIPPTPPRFPSSRGKIAPGMENV